LHEKDVWCWTKGERSSKRLKKSGVFFNEEKGRETRQGGQMKIKSLFFTFEIWKKKIHTCP
jgi:hypothetical protein